MIGTSPGEWIFIRICIAFLRYTPLIYLAILVGINLTPTREKWVSITTIVLASFLLLEALYYAFCYRPYSRRLLKDAIHPTPLSASERRKLFNRCIDTSDSLEVYLRGWFLGAEITDIRRENLREFFAWAFFDAHYYQVENDDAVSAELDDYVATVESRLGFELQEGRGSAESLRLTLDAASSTYRSLLWYMTLFVVDQATHLRLRLRGFQFHAASRAGLFDVFPFRPQQTLWPKRSPAKDLGYWFHPDSDEDTIPVLFFHGIGVGLWTYIQFIRQIHSVSKGQNGRKISIIAVEILPISFRLTSPPLAMAEFQSQMTQILDKHGWDKFTVASHSYGSVLTTHLLNYQPLRPRLAAVVLIDPVTIMLHLPAVAFNFTRRQPKRANEWQLWYFAGTDPGTAHCLARHFFWRENILWKEDLQEVVKGGDNERVAVLLSEQDIIVDAPAVAKYLKAPEEDVHVNETAVEWVTDGIKVLLFPTLDHAQIFQTPSAQDRAAALVRSYCCY